MARDDSSDAGWTGDGGVNGSSGNGGGSGGGGGGWITTTDPGGWSVHHYSGDDRDNSLGGNGGNSNDGSGLNSLGTVALGMPGTIALSPQQWGFGLKQLPTLTPLVETVIARITSFVVPAFISRISSLALNPVSLGLFTAFFSPSLTKEEDVLSEVDKYSLMTMPATQVISTPMSSLASLANIALDYSVISAVLAAPEHISYGVPESIITGAIQVMGLDKPITSQQAVVAPVVSAQPTSKKNVYTASIVPGKPDIQITMSNELISSKPKNDGVVAGPNFVTPISSGEKIETHHSIVTFPDGSGHAPIYVSVSKLLTKAERDALAEKARKEREAWELAFPVEAAELKIITKQKEYDAVASTIFGAGYLDPEKYPIHFERPYRGISGNGAIEYPIHPRTISLVSVGNINYMLLKSWETTHPLEPATTWIEIAQQKYLIEDYNYLHQQLSLAKQAINIAKAELAAAQQHLSVEKAKIEAENARIEAEKAAVIAAAIAAEKARIKAENERIEAERVKAFEEAKAKAIESLQQKIAIALSAPDVVVLDGKIGTVGQISIQGKGVIPDVGLAANEFIRGFHYLANNISTMPEPFLFFDMFSVHLEGNETISLAIPIYKPTKIIDGFVDILTRGEWVNVEDKTHFRIIIDTEGEISHRVNVIYPSLDIETGLYTVSLPEPFGTILITPENPPTTTIPPLGIPIPNIKFPFHTGTLIDIVALPNALGTPIVDDIKYHDYVLIFPDNSGLNPIYVMLSDPRDRSGTATGHGKKIEGNWLVSAGQGLGVPIPDTIADKLRGKEFRNFDNFRKRFWEEVSKNVELTNQLNTQNKANVSKGNSPFTIKEQQVGKRKVYELHHIKPISKGGEVLDMDNLTVITPKRHIDIHRG